MTEECNEKGRELFNSFFDRLRQGELNPQIAESLATLLADCVDYVDYRAKERHEANLALGVEKGSRVEIKDELREQRIRDHMQRLYTLFPEKDQRAIGDYLKKDPRDLASCVTSASFYRNR